jgi:hypothetical protein
MLFNVGCCSHIAATIYYLSCVRNENSSNSADLILPSVPVMQSSDESKDEINETQNQNIEMEAETQEVQQEYIRIYPDLSKIPGPSHELKIL